MRLALARAGFGGREISAMNEVKAAAYVALLCLEERPPVPVARAVPLTPSSVPSGTGANTKTLIPMRRRSKRNE